MELVEGETLAERISRGAIPIDEALPLFIQIAEGLEAAHEKGVIHRDLKPANIKVSDDGRVKILDFGLAKAMAPAGVSETDPSESPTITAAGYSQTRQGQILGTAAYMSPEQAKGKEVDKRADIWAFGACLYEALSGQRAFAAADAADTLAAVLRADIDWDALPSNAPLTLRRLINQCLERDPKRRLRDIGDTIADLEAALEDLAADPSPDLSGQRPGAGRVRWIAFALALAAAGFAIESNALIIGGALVGAAGFFLTVQMTEAMNRGWGDRDSRVAMLLQEERAGVEVRVAEDVLKAALEAERSGG